MGRMSPIIGHLLVFVVVGLVFCFPFGIMKPFTILCFLALLSIVVESKGTTVNITTDSLSTWEGWGTSLAWWAGVFGEREDLADALFTLKNSTYMQSSGTKKTLPGLGLNIVRYNLGACSYNTYSGASIVLSNEMQTTFKYRAMDGYWLDWGSSDPSSSSFNWTKDQNQRDMLLKAKQRGANHFEIFSNSPMWWMCDNLNPGGDNSGKDNLQTWNYQNHAIYLATTAKYFSDNHNINFTTVELYNEPSSYWWVGSGATQEGCHFNHGDQAEIIPELRSALDNNGLSYMDISSSDENTYDISRTTWNSFKSDVKNDVAQVNTHGYQYTKGRRDLLYQDVVVKDQKRLWNSEYGDGQWDASQMSECLLLDFYWLHMSAWVYWQALDGGNWGLIDSNPGTNWIGDVTIKWYVLAQFSRHIREGHLIMVTDSSSTASSFSQKTGELIIIGNGYSGTIEFDVSAYSFSDPNQLISVWVTDTSGGAERYQQGMGVRLQGGKTFSSQFESTKKLKTFVLTGVSMN